MINQTHDIESFNTIFSHGTGKHVLVKSCFDLTTTWTSFLLLANQSHDFSSLLNYDLLRSKSNQIRTEQIDTTKTRSTQIAVANRRPPAVSHNDYHQFQPWIFISEYTFCDHSSPLLLVHDEFLLHVYHLPGSVSKTVGKNVGKHNTFFDLEVWNGTLRTKKTWLV